MLEVNPLSNLTLRNKQVLELVADGLGNNDVAAQLGISPRTVKQHLRYARMRLGLSYGPVNRIKLGNCLRPVTGELKLPAYLRFTGREFDFISAIIQGQMYSEIAATWGSTEQAVKNVARGVFDKTGMDSKAEVVAWYRAHCVSQ